MIDSGNGKMRWGRRGDVRWKISEVEDGNRGVESRKNLGRVEKIEKSKRGKAKECNFGDGKNEF